ncbi:MAG: hypothetical protein CMI24_03010 [Opitutae bacterium]|nr:hypothetical protein [Opitutae bacterium]MEC8419989.1 hypothetical protein [Verrucomicrobiota bacterium]|tara:strand:+ start:94 stop:693 length:600 start_codon:yes stop_codon:yes gene_type:complete
MSEPTEEASADEATKEEELPFDAVDLMLEGNLQAQINYSMVKALAKALDEKASILINAEENFEPENDETFAEVAMPEIEAMSQAIVDGCVNFSKIRFWEACETAEVAWEETKDENGDVVQRVPYGNPLDPPREGNRLLSNIEKIEAWMKEVHKIHEEKGMGWVSPYGCPEDGQQAYDNRAKCLEKLTTIIDGINTNFEG